MKACVTAAYNSPEVAAIRPRRPIDPADATLEQLNSGDLASPEEIKAAYALHDQIVPCRKAGLETLAPAVPTLVPILSDAYEEGDAALLSLVNKKVTWGQYLQSEQHLETDLKAKIAAEMGRIQGEMQQSYAAEMQQRQAALQSMSNYLQNQQMINALSRPVYTNCSTFGSTTNCMSH